MAFSRKKWRSQDVVEDYLTLSRTVDPSVGMPFDQMATTTTLSGPAAAAAGPPLTPMQHMLMETAQRIGSIVGSREAGDVKRRLNGDTVILTIENLHNIWAHTLCPKKWKLTREELDCVVSSVFDATAKVLRVTLVPPNSRRTEDLSRGAWSENMWFGTAPVNPRTALVAVGGTDNVHAELLPLVVSIAKEVVASALVRNGECKTNILLPRNSPPDTVCVLATTGLSIFSSNTLFASRWTTLLTPQIRKTLTSYYSIDSGEHRVRISLATVTAFLGHPVPLTACVTGAGAIAAAVAGANMVESLKRPAPSQPSSSSSSSASGSQAGMMPAQPPNPSAALAEAHQREAAAAAAAAAPNLMEKKVDTF